MVFSLPPKPGKNPGRQPGQKPGQKSGQKSHWFICYFGLFGRSFREGFWTFLTSFSGSFRSTCPTKCRGNVPLILWPGFGQIVYQVLTRFVGQGFDQGLGEGTNHKYSVQHYPALRKTITNNTKNTKKHLKPSLSLFFNIFILFS